MPNMTQVWSDWLLAARFFMARSHPGQALVEYAIVACLVSIAAAVLMSAVGRELPILFQGALNAL